MQKYKKKNTVTNIDVKHAIPEKVTRFQVKSRQLKVIDWILFSRTKRIMENLNIIKLLL